jgi:hypothetical protein
MGPPSSVEPDKPGNRLSVAAAAGPFEGDDYDELRGTWDPHYGEEA